MLTQVRCKAKAIANFGYNSGVDGMVRKLLAKTGKSIDSIEIGDFVPKVEGGKKAHHNILINLK